MEVRLAFVRDGGEIITRITLSGGEPIPSTDDVVQLKPHEGEDELPQFRVTGRHFSFHQGGLLVRLDVSEVTEPAVAVSWV